MAYTYKTWQQDDYYNFDVEFNRIEWYNEYCKTWLKNLGYGNVVFTSVTNWNKSSIIDLQDYNRVKRNINLLLTKIEELVGGYIDKLSISTSYNQTFDYNKANELEEKLKYNLQVIGNWQFSQQYSGNVITGGNNLKLVG